MTDVVIAPERVAMLNAIADAHSAWVGRKLKSADAAFDASRFRKPGSDYNQHHVDLDADGAAEDEFASAAAAILQGGRAAVKAAAKPVVAHLPGEHNQQSHGNDTASVSNALDKLKLGAKVKLRPGERLLATDKARMSPDSEWRLAGAVLDTPAGRQARLGIVGDPKAWDLGTSGGPEQANARMREIVREMDSLESEDDEEVVSDQARYDALRQELDDLESAEFDQTVSLTPEAVAQFKTAIEGPAASAKAFTKAFNKFWDSDENAPILDEIMRLERERSQRGGPGLSPEDEARRVELQADVDRRSTEAGVYETELEFGTGVIPGVGGGDDLGWRVAGVDDSEGGWQLTIAARPPGAKDDWYPGSDEVGIKAIFESADIAGLNKFLDSLIGVQAAAAVVAHLPGRHDQSTHGRRGPKPEVPKAPRKSPATKAEPPATAAPAKKAAPKKAAPRKQAPKKAEIQAAQSHARDLSKGVTWANREQVGDELVRQAGIAPRRMMKLDAVHLPTPESADGQAYAAGKMSAPASAYYTRLGSHPSVYATVDAQADNPKPAIWLSPNWAGDAGFGQMSTAMQRSQNSGWSAPSGAPTPLAATTAHEFGHHIADIFFGEPDVTGTASMRGDVALRLMPALNDALGANRFSPFAQDGDLLKPQVWGPVDNPEPARVHGVMLDEWVRQNKDLVKEKISGYATTNMGELLAEVWREYSTMGAAARPHIKVVGDLMREIAEELER